MTSEPHPSPARLVDALKRLEADLINGAMPADAEARGFLLDRVRRIRAHVSVEVLERSASDPAAANAVILALLKDWASVLDLLRRLDQETAGATRH
jgi:hypothetical protein